MSKAVLVMDMPGNCEECSLSNPDGDYCPFHGEVTYSEYGSKKPSDCPLVPLPKKCNPDDAKTFTDIGYIEGWNGCLKKISGGSNE